MASSVAWKNFLSHLREITELIRVDPASKYSERKYDLTTTNVELTGAITKAAMALTSGCLQGCLSSQVQEFLERLSHSQIVVDDIPDVLRAHLALRYPSSSDRKKPVARAIEIQRASAPLWTDGTRIEPGMIKTSCLPDEIWNPWPDKVQALLRRCDIDLYEEIRDQYGASYLSDMREYVGDLVEFRNQVAHGDEPQPLGITDVRRSMRWAIRLARAADNTLAGKLTALTGQPAW